MNTINNMNTQKKNGFNYFEFIKDNKGLLVDNHVNPKLTLPEIKAIGRLVGVKLTQRKGDLLTCINNILHLHKFSIKIQKIVRTYFVSKWIRLHGPAWNNYSISNNVTDFLTMDSISSLHPFQQFSFKDKEGFVYSFDLVSFNKLIAKKNARDNLVNPYNKSIIPNNVIENFRELIFFSNFLNIAICLESISETPEESPEVRVIRRTQEVFYIIDSLGNFSNSNWFLELDFVRLKRFIRELYDIWNYRAGLSHEAKYQICPNQDPFATIHLLAFHNNISQYPLHYYQNIIIEILSKLVSMGINESSQSLGSYYVLGALTLVNKNAEESLPWLYESVQLNF